MDVTYGFCKCGCGEKTFIPDRNRNERGKLKSVPLLYINHHNLKIYRTEYSINENGCWVSNRSRTPKGYSRIPSINGKSISFHRYFYEKYKGPIPSGLQIDHLCRNRACGNPDHLEAVTAGENSRRGVNSKLNWQKVFEIRSLMGKMGVGLIAKNFSISIAHVYKIAKGSAWARP